MWCQEVLDQSVFDLEHSLHSLSLSLSLSLSGSVHGRKLYRFPFLNLAPSLLIDLLCLTFSLYHNSNPKIDSNFKAYRQNFGMGEMASLVDDLRRNGFAIEARVDNVWSHFSQFGHVLDVYLSKVKVADLYPGGMCRIAV